MLKLYDGTTSVCAIKVRLSLFEKGVPFESHNIDLRAGDQFDPDYLKLNPNAVVPTLVDGDDVVIESSVILQYLEDTRPDPSLFPASAADRARSGPASDRAGGRARGRARARECAPGRSRRRRRVPGTTSST